MFTWNQIACAPNETLLHISQMQQDRIDCFSYPFLHSLTRVGWIYVFPHPLKKNHSAIYLSTPAVTSLCQLLKTKTKPSQLRFVHHLFSIRLVDSHLDHLLALRSRLIPKPLPASGRNWLVEISSPHPYPGSRKLRNVVRTGGTPIYKEWFPGNWNIQDNFNI